MDFDNWTNRNVDADRRKRLLAGYLVGLVTVGSLGTALAISSERVQEEAPEEDVMNVQLQPEPEPEPEAEPEPEPEPAHRAPPEQMLRGPVMPTITTPTAIPDDAPKETETETSLNPYASGDPFQYAGQGGTGRVAAKKVVVAAPVAAPVAVPKGPERMTAGTTPPKAISGGGKSEYPAAARAAGIEGKVVVKYVVTVNGDPEQIQAVSGPEALRAACEATVRGTKFSPAMRDGHPVEVVRTKACSFKLST